MVKNCPLVVKCSTSVQTLQGLHILMRSSYVSHILSTKLHTNCKSGDLSLLLPLTFDFWSLKVFPFSTILGSLNIFMWLSWRVFGVFCTPGALRNVYRAATADMLAWVLSASVWWSCSYRLTIKNTWRRVLFYDSIRSCQMIDEFQRKYFFTNRVKLWPHYSTKRFKNMTFNSILDSHVVSDST